MKLPRDVTGVELAKSLSVLGYSVVRQSGSHIWLSTQQNGEHHISIPAHVPLKVGILAAILADIAAHHKLNRDEVLERLFP